MLLRIWLLILLRWRIAAIAAGYRRGSITRRWWWCTVATVVGRLRRVAAIGTAAISLASESSLRGQRHGVRVLLWRRVIAVLLWRRIVMLVVITLARVIGHVWLRRRGA